MARNQEQFQLPEKFSRWGEVKDFNRRIWVWAKGHLLSSVFGSLAVVALLISYLVSRVEAGVQGANIVGFADAVWWAVVTLLTVGYGDRFPVTTEGRLLASLLMFSGVFSVAILTSKIASVFLEQVLLEGRGHVKTSELQDHFVVCGWRRDMEELLCHILEFNQDLYPENLVVVCNVEHSNFESLRDNPKLSKVQFVHGDFSQESVLRRVAPERARKIMILADQTPTPTGSMPSPTETDARTIMAAMTLSHIARGTTVTAEILDPNMDQYLRMAHVTEIIYSREYSRLLLGNASSGTGISNIIFDLLDPQTPARILTLPIAEALIGQTFQEVRQSIESQHSNCVVIGILENTGNSYRIKEQALRKAQKTPDIQKLVDNLKSVKGIKYNHPVFNPAPDLIVQEGAMAIVVRVEVKAEAQHGSTQMAA